MLSTDNSLRRRAIDAALAVLRESGPEGLSTRAVAERAGVTQPALYRHFENKDALVREVMREVRARFRDRFLDALESAPTARERLLAGMDAFRAFSVEEPGLYDALFATPPRLRPTSRDSPEPTSSGGASRDHSFGLLVDRVAEVVAEGQLRTMEASSVALMFAALGRGLVSLYRRGRYASDDAYAAHFRAACEALLRGLS